MANDIRIRQKTKKEIERAVKYSSLLEGLSFFHAKRNKKAIKILKQYARTFSL